MAGFSGCSPHFAILTIAKRQLPFTMDYGSQGQWGLVETSIMDNLAIQPLQIPHDQIDYCFLEAEYLT